MGGEALPGGGTGGTAGEPTWLAPCMIQGPSDCGGGRGTQERGAPVPGVVFEPIQKAAGSLARTRKREAGGSRPRARMVMGGAW